jgi:hypothetical protein
MSDEPLILSRGDRFVANGKRSARQRLYIEVTRVAKDRTWADIRVCNCYVMWTKRQPLDDRGMLPSAERCYWDERDIDQQERCWDG